MSSSSTSAEAPAERLTLWGDFVSREQEQSFRARELPANISRVRALIFVCCSIFFINIWSDRQFFGDSAKFQGLVVLRTAVLAISLSIWFRLPKLASPSGLLRYMLGWSISAAAVLVYAAINRPPNYVGYTVVVTFCVLMGYCVVPLPLLWQATVGLGMTIGLLTLNQLADPVAVVALSASLITANMLGMVVSRELNVWKRQQYLALEREKRVRLGLEQALAEIKHLRGILPICAHCKKIRDDSGYWHQVETYVARHTDAAFSHGICPDCVTAHFSDLSLSDENYEEAPQPDFIPSKDRSAE